MLTRPYFSRGMSLIELMIGVALVAVIITIAIPSFSVAMQNRQIRTAADSIQNALQFARTEALRRNREIKFSIVAATSWKVGCVTVDAAADCLDELQSRNAAEGSPNAVLTTSETVASTGVAAGTTVFDGSLVFTPLGRVKAASLGAGNLANYQVSNPTGGACAAASGEMRCLNVVVSTSGQIRMCDPGVAAGDPRAC